MSKFVIGFTGKIGSGKSSVAHVTAQDLGVACASFGDYVRSVAPGLGLNPSDRGVLQDIGNLLVKYPHEFCTQVLGQVGYRQGNSVVIEGIRHKQILDELKNLTAPARFVLVYVQTDESVIERRLHQEGLPEPKIQLLEHDRTEAQVATLLPKLADLVVDGSRERTAEEIRTEVVPVIRAYLEAEHEEVRAGAPFKPPFGGSRGTFQMADDFDEPVEDFADYM